MPYCERCGRQLEDGQVCNCAANQNPNLNQEKIQPPPQNFQQFQPPPPIYPNGVIAEPPKKKSNVALIICAIVIPILLVILIIGGILAAIFVPAMLGYTKKSKLAAQNSYSSSISKAVNSVLTELDEEGYDINSAYGNYFICSEAGNSFCFDSLGDDLDYTDFNNRVNEYFMDSDDGKWFAVVERGSVTYVASASSWDSETVGTYPASSVDYVKGYGITYYDEEELGEIYEDALDAIYYY